MKKLLLFLILLSATIGSCFADDILIMNIGLGSYNVEAPYETENIPSVDSYIVLGPQVSVITVYDMLAFELGAEIVATVDNNFRYGDIPDVEQYYKDSGFPSAYLDGHLTSLNTYLGVGSFPISNEYLTMTLTAGITESAQFQFLDVYGPGLKDGDIDDSRIIDESSSYFYTSCGLASKINIALIFDKYGVNLFGFIEKELLRTKWTGTVSTMYSPVYRYGGGVSVQILFR